MTKINFYLINIFIRHLPEARSPGLWHLLPHPLVGPELMVQSDTNDVQSIGTCFDSKFQDGNASISTTPPKRIKDNQ